MRAGVGGKLGSQKENRRERAGQMKRAACAGNSVDT